MRPPTNRFKDVSNGPDATSDPAGAPLDPVWQASVAPDSEVIALIAYLQKLGKYEPVLHKAPEQGSRLSD